jgi:hypothetical protein
MPLNFPSSSLTVGQLYEGWVWNGSAWDFVGRSVGITTTASPTTTTTSTSTTTTSTSTTTTSTSTTTTSTTTTLPAGPTVMSFSLYTGNPTSNAGRNGHIGQVGSTPQTASPQFDISVVNANGFEYGIVSSNSNTTPTSANLKQSSGTVSGNGLISLPVNGVSDAGETWYFRAYIYDGVSQYYYSSNVLQLRLPDIKIFGTGTAFSYDSGTQEITATCLLSDMLSGSPIVTAVGIACGSSTADLQISEVYSPGPASSFTQTVSVSSLSAGGKVVRAWADQVIGGQTIRVYDGNGRNFTKI